MSVVRILTYYFHKTYRRMFFNNFFSSGQKLPWSLYIDYQVCSADINILFAHKLPTVCFSTTFPQGQKVTKVFVYRLPGPVCILPWCLCIINRGHIIQQFSSRVKSYHSVRTWVINFALHILPYYLHINYRVICFQQLFFSGQKLS